MENSTSYDIILRYVPSELRMAMQKVAVDEREKVNEIRIRSCRAVSYVFPERTMFLQRSGKLSDDSDGAFTAAPADINSVVSALSRHSLHSCTRELHQGFFVIGGGIRVGVAGTYSDTSNQVLREFSGLNFRIAREVTGCAELIHNRIGRGKGILICGGVNSGKTTVLRDLCRLTSRKYKVTLVDERGEIAAMSGGVPLNDVGVMTDVLTGCSRNTGIVSAIRTLSPDYIFCDEIATDADCDAILSAYGCGVGFAATIHAADCHDLKKRFIASRLISQGVFSYAVFLAGSHAPGKIREIRRIGDVD